jgi:rhamnosyltransferase
MDDLAIIIILFNPSIRNIQHIRKYSEAFHLIVVDNTPGTKKIPFNSIYIHLGKNKGIAYAQNVGIKYAIKKKYKYLLFFDQDSEPPIDYTYHIYNEYLKICSIKKNVGFVGPKIINIDNHKEYKKTKGMKKENQNIFLCEFMISSGSIISTDCIQKVGYMDEMLFIDLVDYEYCWRLKKYNYNCYITDNVKLYHRVGYKEISVLGIPFIISSPQRYYYQNRNGLLLLKRGYVPLSWKIRYLFRFVIFLIVIPLKSKDYKSIYHYTFMGIKEGMKINKIN